MKINVPNDKRIDAKAKKWIVKIPYSVDVRIAARRQLRKMKSSNPRRNPEATGCPPYMRPA
jgi:hypothetical protein